MSDRSDKRPILHPFPLSALPLSSYRVPKPTMPKAPAQLLQTFRREQILDAARDVIGEQGYEGTSVDQIARRAGVSRSTVYEYFSSKDEILRGCFSARRDQIADELAGRFAAAPDLETRLTAFFEICLARVDESREFFLAIAFPLPPDAAMASETASEGPGGDAFAQVIRDFDEAMNRILEAGHADGELAGPVGPEDRACLGTLVVGAMGARSRLETPPPAAQSAAAYARFALRGLGIAPGRAGNERT